MRINRKFNHEIKTNVRYLLKYVTKMSDTEIDSQAELVLGLIKLVTSDEFYSKHSSVEFKYSKMHWESAEFVYSSFDTLKSTNPKKYKQISEQRQKILAESVSIVCAILDIDQNIFEPIIKTYFETKRLKITPHTKDLSISEYRHKVKIVNTPRNISDQKSIFIQLFSDTTISSVRRFLEENSDQIEKLKKLTTKYPYTHNFDNLRQTIIALLMRLLGMSYVEIVDTLYKHSTIKPNQRENVRKSVAKLNKMLF